MNFIVKWCMARCNSKRDCTVCTKRYCDPREELAAKTGCSKVLIGLLQSMNDAKTHPNIADRIADFIGATPEERDQIVARKHHGTYVPGKAKPKPVSCPFLGWNIRTVVAVNRYATELDRYPSAAKAAEQFGIHDSSVIYRCKRKVTASDEFAPIGATFRFADEWDSMTEGERLLDLMRTTEPMYGQTHGGDDNTEDA